MTPEKRAIAFVAWTFAIMLIGAFIGLYEGRLVGKRDADRWYAAHLIVRWFVDGCAEVPDAKR